MAEKIEHPYVMVCTPAYDGKVDVDYSQSLAESFQAATIFGIRAQAVVMGNGAFIDLARNTYVRIFLEDEDFKECTHLFFIDSDLKFPPQAFCNLIVNCTQDRPVTAGVYPRRQEPLDYPCHWIPVAETKAENGTECLWIEDDYWLQCDRVPTGFLCIHRSVLEKMAANVEKMHVHGQPPTPRLFYTKIDDGGRFVGEDYSWCDDYMALFDKPISVQMDIDFTHGKRYKGNYQAFLTEKVEEYKKSQTEKPRRLGERRKKVA